MPSECSALLCALFFQESYNITCQCMLVFCFTIPNRQHRPPLHRQRTSDISVSCSISFYLLPPIVSIGLGDAGTALAVVAMPKASVDENHFSAAYEREIGLSGQIVTMKTVTVAHLVNQTPYNHFRAGILSPDPPHNMASLLSRLH